ncbi:hypothetical protein TNIN_240471 [Trichonephila inaurata madagascariensis]|uniref:Uncharacterized protein n=1 Tax=Trichonephila inaurata madagascariensis TaxID=2747483 RepID=A0A8X7BTQ1_9ARAC|nr:hypothetical protein TNIN_240471 [Trichonephila inaurata madagascariensis]
MNSRDFRVLFLYEWKGDHNAAAAVRNINVVLENCSTFESGTHISYLSDDESLNNEIHDRPVTVGDNEILRAITENNPCNTI